MKPASTATASAIVAPDFYNVRVERVRTEIAVVGAGTVGMTAALALSQAGFKVALIHRDPLPAPRPVTDEIDLRVFALAPQSREILDRTGAWSAMSAERICPVMNMLVYPDVAPGAQPVNLSAAQGHVDALAWIAEASQIDDALRELLRTSAVQLVAGEVSQIDEPQDKAVTTLQLAGGRQVQASLIVAADGARSAIRAMAAIPVSVKSYEQRALVFNLRCDEPHLNQARQWFGAHGVLALLPLPDANQVSVVWSAPLALAEELSALDARDLATRVGGISHEQTGALQLISETRGFDLSLQRAASLASHRMVLAGDSAHVIHPLAGQGLNLGLGDVSALVTILTESRERWHGAGFDPGQPLLLRRYQRHRAEPVAAIAAVTDGLQGIFNGRSGPTSGVVTPVVRLLREAGWQVAVNSSLVRRQIIRYATQSASN